MNRSFMFLSPVCKKPLLPLFWYTVIGVFSVLSSCQKSDVVPEPKEIITLGHGGMGISSLLPLNSNASLTKCLELDCHGTEIDIQLTKDGKPVAFHDQDLSEKTDMEGILNAYTWEELKDCQYINTPLEQHRLVLLDDFFSENESYKSRYFTFDCKLYKANQIGFNELFADAIYALAKKHNLIEKLCVEAQDTAFLLAIKKRDPVIKTFLYHDSFQAGLELVRLKGFTGISIAAGNVSAEEISTAHAAGLLVAVWNIQTSAENSQAIEKKPDYIQTDRLKDLISKLE